PHSYSRSYRNSLVESVPVCLSSAPALSVLPRETPELADTLTRCRVTEAYTNLPLSFEANLGQADASADFIARGDGHTVSLKDGDAVIGQSITLRLYRASEQSTPRAIPEGELAGRINYFVGDDPTHWRSDIPTYSRVKYENVYPGISLVYYGNQRQLEYDFVVAPGADPAAIRFDFDGAEGFEVNEAGDLV